MDRHQAALLKMLSFDEEYRSTSKPVNILNTVAQPIRQMTSILPNIANSVVIPDYVPRRSRNTRLTRNKNLNPIYDLGCETSNESPIIGNDGDHDANDCRIGKSTHLTMSTELSSIMFCPALL